MIDPKAVEFAVGFRALVERTGYTIGASGTYSPDDEPNLDMRKPGDPGAHSLDDLLYDLAGLDGAADDHDLWHRRCAEAKAALQAASLPTSRS